MDVEDEAVGEDGEEGREAFNCVDEGDGDFFGSGGGEDVSTNLEHGEWEGGFYYIAGGIADAMFENRNGSLEWREEATDEGKGDTPGGDAGELDDGKGNWLGKGVEDGFGRCVGKCGAHVPYKAEDLEIQSVGESV